MVMNTRQRLFRPRTWSFDRLARSRHASAQDATWPPTMITKTGLFGFFTLTVYRAPARCDKERRRTWLSRSAILGGRLRRTVLRSAVVRCGPGNKEGLIISLAGERPSHEPRFFAEPRRCEQP